MSTSRDELAARPILYTLRTRRGRDVWYVVVDRADGTIDGWSTRGLLGTSDEPGGWFAGWDLGDLAIVAEMQLDVLDRDTRDAGRTVTEVVAEAMDHATRRAT